MSIREEIIASFTRTMFVDAYASFVERLREDREPTDDLDQAGPGEDWMDHAPDTTEAAAEYATTAIARIESGNLSVEMLYAICTAACGAKGARCNRKRHSPEEFGHYLAMQYVGHGVAWNDDHATRLELPYGEGPFIGDRTDAGLPEREE